MALSGQKATSLDDVPSGPTLYNKERNLANHTGGDYLAPLYVIGRVQVVPYREKHCKRKMVKEADRSVLKKQNNCIAIIGPHKIACIRTMARKVAETKRLCYDQISMTISIRIKFGLIITDGNFCRYA